MSSWSALRLFDRALVQKQINLFISNTCNSWKHSEVYHAPLCAETEEQPAVPGAWSPGLGHCRERLDSWHPCALCVVWGQRGGGAHQAARENGAWGVTASCPKHSSTVYKSFMEMGRDNLCWNLHRCQPEQKWGWVIVLFPQEIQPLWNVRSGLLAVHTAWVTC